jgi:uncharacterized protein (DUF2132 family)
MVGEGMQNRRQNPCMKDAPTPPQQPRNPLHGVTLEAMVRALEAHYGWGGLAQQIPIRCFTHEPSVNSSLKFLRKTPWAREKVESLYLFMLRENRRAQRTPGST